MSNPALDRLNKRRFDTKLFTVSKKGVTQKSAILFLLMASTFVWAWGLNQDEAMGLSFLAVLIGFGFGLWTIFVPNVARFTAPAYAMVQGVVLGGVSKAYDVMYPGIVFQAVALTMFAFVTMLIIYQKRIIKVDDKFKQTMGGMLLAILVYYIISIVLTLFKVPVPLIHDSGWMGVGVSVVISGVAAFCFLLDFDMIEEMEGNAPVEYEWYCGFSLMVTFIWLYMEILRLIQKIRD